MAFNFSKVLEKDEGSVLIVDSLNLAFRWKHQGRTDFCDEYVKTVVSLAHSYRCENIIITSDLGTSTYSCLLYTSPSPRDRQKSRMPSSA